MKKRIVALLFALLMVLSCASASAAVYYRLTATVRLWSDSDYDSKVLDTYRRDWAFTITKKVNSTWAAVRFTNGKKGFVERRYFATSKARDAWITQDDTPLRRGPDYGFATVAKLDRGTKVKIITSGASYNYVRTTSGKFGYVAASVLSKKKVSPTPAAKSTKTENYTAWIVSNGGKVGLRSKPSGSNSVVFAQYSPGTKITVLKHGDPFDYVSVNGSKGYMRTKYVSKVRPAAKTYKPVFKAYTARARKAADGTKPRLYKGCGLGYSWKSVPTGTTVQVIDKAEDIYWVKVKVNNVVGYMYKKCLRK